MPLFFVKLEGVGRLMMFRSARYGKYLVLVLCACTVIGLFFSSQIYLVYRQIGTNDWGIAIHSSLVNWYAWGVMTLLVVNLALWFPVNERPHWLKIVLHFLMAFILALSHTSFCVSWYWLFKSRDRSLTEWTLSFERGFLYYFHWDVLIYFAILGFIYAANYYQSMRHKEMQASQLQAELDRSRFDALRMQMNPHFLFNSLNAVSELVHESPPLAEKVVTQLASLLRTILEEGNKQEVTLRQEIDFNKKYLEIERIRFGSRLQLHFMISENHLDLMLPSFVLQPLIENAVRHGIAPSEEGGTIEVISQIVERHLLLQVRNTKPKNPQDRRSKVGVGLANLRARLTLRYGQDFLMELLDSQDGIYAASISIPLCVAQRT